MSDLIKREDAIRWVKTECNPYGKPTLDFESGKKVIEHLEHMPSADRPQGEWIVSDDKYFHTCQFCNADVDVSMGTGIFVDNDEVSHMNFCPNCGARMKGADDE